MKFEYFEAKFVKETRKLKGILAIVLLIGCSAIFLILSERKYFIYQGGEIFKERLLAEDICREAFSGIVNGKPHHFFVTDEILSLLKKESFKVEEGEILKLKSIDQGKCSIIIKGKPSPRSFIVTLASSDLFPFFYKLSQIDEIEFHQGEDR